MSSSLSSCYQRRFPFQLLEITLISAQDLSSASRSMQTYAVAWVNPDRRLATRVDQHGHANPTWNDKFVFRVDDAFLASATSAVMIEIFAVSWLRDVKLGAVRVLVSSLLAPSPAANAGSHSDSAASAGSMRFVALQIRRPSGRPQGILNVGVTLLDNAMRSMPLYRQLSTSAVGYHDLMMMGDRDRNNNDNNNNNKDNNNNNNNNNKCDRKPPLPPVLRRSQSERTADFQKQRLPSSLCIGSIYNGSVGNGSPRGGVGHSSVLSDLGPSPSIVAAAVARGLYRLPQPPGAAAMDDDVGSSVLGDWTEASSVEGLRSKLERWRTEMPPIYDRDRRKVRTSSSDSKSKSKIRSNNRRQGGRRWHGDGGGSGGSRSSGGRTGRGGGGGGGLFSCFANAYGCEFSIVCGRDASKVSRKRRIGGSGRAPLCRSEGYTSTRTYD